MKKRFILFLFTIGLLSCEKELNIKLSNGTKKIVVEGSIEVGQSPFITLTESIGFFDAIDLSKISFVRNAVVNITDINDNQTITLKEYTIDTLIGNSPYSFTIYGPDYSDPNSLNFKGILNHTYKLSIEVNGTQLESYTQIAATPGLDSIWLEPVPGKEDSFSTIKAYYTDPDTFGNSVKLETLTNRYEKDGNPESYFTSYTPVYNDDIVNNTKVKLDISLGYDKSRELTPQELISVGYIKKGDTVTIKWSGIDKDVYAFWETLTFSAGSVGNPFASPVQVQTNVKNALGVWGGYGSHYYKIIDSIK